MAFNSECPWTSAWHACYARVSRILYEKLDLPLSSPPEPIRCACSSPQLIVCTITNYLSGGALNQPRQDPAWTFKSIPHEKSPSPSSLSSDSSLVAATSASDAVTQAAEVAGPQAPTPPSYSQPEQPPHLHSGSGKGSTAKQPQSNGSPPTASPYDSELEQSDTDADGSTEALPRWRQVLASTVRGWRYYFASPVLPASLAYVLLYSNAMLSPGSLMTSLLTHRGECKAMSTTFHCLQNET